MTERSDNAKHQHCYQTNSIKMPENDLGTRKTLFVLVIVVGCFAVLWPKVFYPMLVGPTNQRMKPNHLDKGCCDVISDIDVNAIMIMSELCNTIVQHPEEKLLKTQEVIKQCRSQIYDKCGIDISLILQEQVRLGRSFKQIVDEVRSFNGSFCLKYQFGISPSRLGIPHRVTINLSPANIKQERPSHLRPEMLHPALRERGSAIVQPYQPPTKPGHPKFVDGRPGPVPGVRPPLGGAGHMVHSPKGSNSMGVIMPIYTIGIVIFFSYTLMKLLFKKKPEGAGAPLYPPVEPSMTFRKEVFESQKTKSPQGPLIVNAMTALLDEVDQELEARRKARELASQKEDLPNGTGLINGCAKLPPEPEQPSVKILGMEMTASCEGGQKWERCESPVIPKSQLPEPSAPPQEIYLEGTLPAQSQLLVTDSTIEEETNSLSSSTDPPVILASKMTLSVISLDTPDNDLQNERHTNDQDTTEDIVDESKYTTASNTTAAECEISDEEASDINDEIENAADDDTDLINIEESHIQNENKIDSIVLDTKETDTINKFQGDSNIFENEKENAIQTLENLTGHVIEVRQILKDPEETVDLKEKTYGHDRVIESHIQSEKKIDPIILDTKETDFFNKFQGDSNIFENEKENVTQALENLTGHVIEVHQVLKDPEETVDLKEKTYGHDRVIESHIQSEKKIDPIVLDTTETDLFNKFQGDSNIFENEKENVTQTLENLTGHVIEVHQVLKDPEETVDLKEKTDYHDGAIETEETNVEITNVEEEIIEAEDTNMKEKIDAGKVLIKTEDLNLETIDAEENNDQPKHLIDTSNEIVKSEAEIEDEEEIEEEEDIVDSDVEEIEDIHDDIDENSLDDEEIEEIIVFEDEIDVNDDYEDEDDGNVHVFISNQTVENIGNIIDEIITDGARRLEAVNDIDNNISENLEHSTEDFDENSEEEEEEEEEEDDDDDNENIHDTGVNIQADLENHNHSGKDVCIDDHNNLRHDVVSNSEDSDRVKLDSPTDSVPVE